MCGARTDVLVLTGPGERPDGVRAVSERYGGRLGVSVTWRDAEDAARLAAWLRDDGPDHAAVVLASGALSASAEVAAAVRATDRPVVHVDTAAVATWDVVPDACDHAIHGRHRRSFHGALDWLTTRWAHPPTTVAYGPDPVHLGDLRLPDGGGGAPVVVLLHGGFWLDPWERDLMARLAVRLTANGWATWNVEYRRRGPTGGGWPATLQDACAAVDAVADLAVEHLIDPGRVVLLGHSAGAQLGVYAATRDRAPASAPGRVPRVHPAGIVALAGLLDLEAAVTADLADGAVAAFLGAPQEHPERYAVASPIRRVPLDAPVLAVHGPEDHLVPVAQTTGFSDAARDVGDEVELALVDASHLDMVDPDGPAMEVVSDWLARLGRG